MRGPSVILKSQFTTPEAKSFTRYYEYMTRKEALGKKEKSLTEEEIEEINRIDLSIKRFDMREGYIYSSGKKEDTISEKEYEAELILRDKDSFSGTDIDYGKYISYMSRQYALEKKENLTETEKKELLVVRKKNSDHTLEKKEVPGEKLVPGVFSIDQNKMTNKELKDVHYIIEKAQNNGSIFYQDVISFDTDFLIKEKLLNPETNELNEKRIQDASRKMMEKMFEDESIQSGYWFASIHRNTAHLHIHYGTVEHVNTRKVITVKKDGIDYLEPKGKRKQKTIDNMKSIFSNELIDRTSELSRISELRNTLVKDIKEIYSNEKEELEPALLLKELYSELPSNKKNWQYGSKHISDNTRNKIDQLTDSLMNDNPNFQEYLQKTQEESEYRKELFGESNRSEKNYAENKDKEIHKRLGNSLLKEMNKTSNTIERAREYKKEVNNEKEKSSVVHLKKYDPYINKINLYQFKRALNEDYEKYRAEKEYEQMKQRIALEQQNNEI